MSVRYSKDHEWVRMEGDAAVVGISDYAQEQLGEIVFVELPDVGKQLENGVPRKRVGIRPDGKAPARAHTAIEDTAGNTIGEVTSGGYGPSVEGPVAMGYVETGFAAAETPVNLIVRGKALPGRVVKLPFVEQRYFNA